MKPEALECARLIFEYHKLNHEPRPADAMIVLGTNDIRVAAYAAGLYREQFAPLIVTTGGLAHQQDLLATNWDRPEAEVFAGILCDRGVPRDRVLVEPRALNTAENIRYSRAILEQHRPAPKSVLIVVKPFMQRRAMATHSVEWPEMPASAASPLMTFDEYCHGDLTPEKVANIIMGDLQRIWVYAGLGYSAPQRMPESVMHAFERLRELGYTRHLIEE
jgi:uncharacterized SAM-binding protein YcdF (DUF218 family)